MSTLKCSSNASTLTSDTEPFIIPRPNSVLFRRAICEVCNDDHIETEYIPAFAITVSTLPWRASISFARAAFPSTSAETHLTMAMRPGYFCSSALS